VTFFAPDDRAIPDPPKRNQSFVPDNHSLGAIIDLIPDDDAAEWHDDDDKRKKFFKHLVHAVLSYSTLPVALNGTEIGANLTYPTLLKAHDHSYGGEARRVRISAPIFHHGGAVNFFAGFKFRPIHAKNGIIYVISAPLLPPPSIADEAFWAPRAFSTYASFPFALSSSIRLTGDFIDLFHPKSELDS
jgi:hypothetical protein